MPPVDLPHVIERWTEVGLTGSNGMAATPLSWGEINEWQRATSIRISPWEARLIRSLSIAYIAQSRLSEDEACPPPWRGEITEAEKQREVSILDAVLG